MKISDQLYEEAEHYNTDPRVVQEIDPDSIKKLADKVKELENSLDLVTREYLGGAGEIYLETIMNRSRLDHLGPGTTINPIGKRK